MSKSYYFYNNILSVASFRVTLTRDGAAQGGVGIAQSICVFRGSRFILRLLNIREFLDKTANKTVRK